MSGHLKLVGDEPEVSQEAVERQRDLRTVALLKVAMRLLVDLGVAMDETRETLVQLEALGVVLSLEGADGDATAAAAAQLLSHLRKTIKVPAIDTETVAALAAAWSAFIKSEASGQA
jgi:hypothetical protein